MTAIWHNTGGRWGELQPVGFPDEAALHDLVELSPEMLPLSGSPHLAILGREVRLGTGSADLVGMDREGRIAIIEIKLRSNPEARRAVVAQVLAYASIFYRMGHDDVESTLLTHLHSRGFQSLSEAVAQQTQSEVDPGELREAISANLLSGQFRLVLVLDDIPPELVDIVAYLEAVAQGVVIDLIKVSAYQVGGDQIMVPQRIDPVRLPLPSASRLHQPTEEPPSTPGAEGFLEAIANASPEVRQHLTFLAEWAITLADAGLARLRTTFGKTRTTLAVRIKGSDSGPVTIATDNGGSVWLWRSVLERRAPVALEKLDEWFGQVHRSLPTVLAVEVTDTLLDILREAYVEAASPRM